MRNFFGGIGSTLRRVSLTGGGPVPPSQALGDLSQEEVRVEPAQVDQPEHHRPSIPILILGRYGSPKTQFVNAARALMGTEPEPDTNPADVTSKRVVISKNSFKLIDTPGFDDPKRSNLDVFEKIVNYLMDENRRPHMTGIVYIHQTGDSLKSRALKQNLEVLFDVLLGKSGLSRLTVLVVPLETGGSGHCASVIREMETPGSIFHAAYQAGARIMVSRFDQTDLINILEWYAAKDPIRLRIQRAPPDNLRDKIEAVLGYCETDAMNLRLSREAESVARPYRNKIVSLQSALDESQSTTKQYHAAYKQLDHEVARKREEILALRQQLQQTQAEYSSLRSQLQLQENVEQSEVVQMLKDLNRSIDDIGRSFSAYLVDKYVQTTFGKDPGDITTLDARELTKLQELFDHVDGRSSLVVSSSGTGMPVEDFLDYATRSLICAHLCKRIFSTFHPGAESMQNKVVATMYDDVQQREPQAVSAKWRANCFKSIYRPETPDVTAQHIHQITSDFFTGDFSSLVTSFFGNDSGVQLDGKHFDQLQQLVRESWDWNATLKGEVIVLGDFYQTYYSPFSPFDATYMEEFEPRGGVRVDTILGTLALGLISTRAVGGGRRPEMTVVCKAVVATKSLYDMD